MNKLIHVGIIDDDEDYITHFARFFVGLNVKITSFISEKQITSDVMKEFDMVYVDYELGWIHGNDLINELSKHTNADFSLISTANEHFEKSNINNKNITAIITKDNKEYILEWFYYIKNKRANLYPRT